VEYAVNQLVEMAVRAMSPAINDPFTAMTCLDYLGEGLALFIRQCETGSRISDTDGDPGCVEAPVTFGELLGASFDMLRHASCDNASVLSHMLAVIEVVGREAQQPETRQQLRRHVDLILAESGAGELIEQDQRTLHVIGDAIKTRLEGSP
jgi:uncharacterized membrane protein